MRLSNNIIVLRVMTLLSFVLLTACTHTPDFYTKGPEFAEETKTQSNLLTLSGPRSPIAVSVYGYADQTGQFKPTDVGQTLSRAVSQGGTSILIRALKDAGNGSWFTVVERENLTNLLRERQIIREMRQQYLGETRIDKSVLPPLKFAGVLLEGGIIGYDTNTITGGAGARLLGIGGNAQYRQDTVTVYLRAVSVKTGEVLTNVVARKTIASVGAQGDAFRFIAFQELLEAEAGISYNEPDQIALEKAIEKAVYGLIMEGARLGIWHFGDRAEELRLLADYYGDRAGDFGQLAQNELEEKERQRALAQEQRKQKLLAQQQSQLRAQQQAHKEAQKKAQLAEQARLRAQAQTVPTQAPILSNSSVQGSQVAQKQPLKVGSVQSSAQRNQVQKQTSDVRVSHTKVTPRSSAQKKPETIVSTVPTIRVIEEKKLTPEEFQARRAELLARAKRVKTIAPAEVGKISEDTSQQSASNEAGEENQRNTSASVVRASKVVAGLADAQSVPTDASKKDRGNQSDEPIQTSELRKRAEFLRSALFAEDVQEASTGSARGVERTPVTQAVPPPSTAAQGVVKR